MSYFDDNEVEQWWDEICYFQDFLRFVRSNTSEQFCIVLTIDYELPFECSIIIDTLTILSSPKKLTLPLDECFRSVVTPFVQQTLHRYRGVDIVGISYNWENVDAVCGVVETNEPEVHYSTPGTSIQCSCLGSSSTQQPFGGN